MDGDVMVVAHCDRCHMGMVWVNQNCKICHLVKRQKDGTGRKCGGNIVPCEPYPLHGERKEPTPPPQE